MTRPFINFAGLFALSTAAALDLTPQAATKELEGGYRISVLHFTDAGKTIQYRPPKGWEASGGATALTLTPREIPQAVARISVVPRNAKSGTVATPDTELEKWVTAGFLPAEATGVERTDIYDNAFMLGPIPSREYQYRYELSGRTFMKSISVVDFNERERVVVEVSAGSTHFARARKAVVGSLFSWGPVE